MLFEIRTARRDQLIDVTDRVAEYLAQTVAEKGMVDGAVLVFCPHTTAGITINENADPDVVIDVLEGLARIAPRQAGWRHREGNSDGHLKASLVGSSVTVPVSGGCLQLGTWQGIYLCEFDGPRTRRVSVTVLS